MKRKALISIVALLLYGNALCCDLNSASPLPAQLASLSAAQTPRQVVISNNVQLNVPQADGLLQMHSADRFALLDQLTYWPTQSGAIGSVKSQPVILDQDYDGIADALYLADVSGLLWFVPLSSAGFSEPQLIADLSATQAQFHQPLQLVQTQTADHTGQIKKQTMLLVIANQPEQGDMLFAVKHQPGQEQLVNFDDLTDRTDINAEEQRSGITAQLWRQLQQSSGWFVRLAQRITVVPQIYAGVVYFTSADASLVRADCSVPENTDAQLYALHLHHAGTVYARRRWQVPTTFVGELTLDRSSDDELELHLKNEQQQQTLLGDMLGIADECANCTAALSTGQFPRIIRLATFQIEQGAQ